MNHLVQLDDLGGVAYAESVAVFLSNQKEEDGKESTVEISRQGGSEQETVRLCASLWQRKGCWQERKRWSYASSSAVKSYAQR